MFVPRYKPTQTQGDIAILLSTPRVGSTAVLMSMKNSGREIYHEPGVRAYQSLYEPGTVQGEKEVVDIQPTTFPTFDSILVSVNRQLKHDKNIFIKEMIFAAKHYVDNPIFANACYFFLLRSPEESIVSNYKLYPRVLDKVLRDILSQEESLKFYTHLKNLGRQVYLMRSEDLKSNPAAEILKLCTLAHIPFDESMLQWKPLEKEASKFSEYFHVLPDWHDKAARSTGFDPTHFSSIERIEGKPTFREIPPEHRQAYIDFYEEQLPFYNQLIRLSSSFKPRL